MDAARWERMQTLFHAALDLPAPERPSFLDGACVGEPGLRADVEAMLAEDSGKASVLDRALAHLAHDVLDGSVPPLRTVGPYRVLGVLGHGGMGVVYLAEHADLGRCVALKVLRDAALSPARRERFEREEQTLARLAHPAIARLYNADTLPDGTPFFAMEYVEGEPLTDHCAAHRCALTERLRLFRAVCEAVQYAHREAVIHRDLKPSNVLVTPEGSDGAPSVKLLDFGIAKSLESLDAPAAATHTELRLMTPAYAAPEQFRGEPVGIYTDVYALGVILYELLAGRLPFDLAGLTPGQAEALVTEQSPAPPSLQALGERGLPAGSVGKRAWADLDVLCLTAMHPDPQRRYATVEALVRDLDHFLDGKPLEARPDSLGYRVGKFLRRHRQSVAAAALVLAVLVGLVGFYTARLADARDTALAEAARTERVQRFVLNLFQGGDEAAGPADSLRVVTLIDRGVQEARVLDAEPAIQAELYHTLGTISQQLGDFDRADSLLQAALAQRRTHFGPDHPDVALSLLALGNLHVEQADFDEAERLAREGLALSRRLLAPGHPALAEAVTALGKVLQERGEYDRAIELLEEAVRLRAAQDSVGLGLSQTITELANTHFYAGHYAASDSLNRLALAMDQRLYGRRHPSVASSLANLGATQHQLGQYAEAEQFYRQALAISLAYYGEDHYETAAKLLLLGQALTFQEHYDEALDALRPALAVRERVYGPDHPRVASVLNEMGTVALRQGDQATAEAHYRRVVEIYRTAHGERHYYVGIGLSNLASAYRHGERYDRAEEAIREALAIFTDALGADHVNTAIAQLKLGSLLVMMGRHAEAEAPLLAGYEILSPQMDASNQWLVDARADLATVYDALGEPDEATRFRAELAEATAEAAR